MGRPSRLAPFTISVWQLAWLSAAGVLVGGSLGAANLETIDFADFYASAQAAWAGDGWYPRDNLNPPSFVLVTAALALMPQGIAYVAWLLASLTALAWSVATAVRRGAISRTHAVWVLGACGAITPGWMAWQLGQVTYLLLALVAAGWLAGREGRPVRAGVWLGIACAIKPPLLLAAVALPRRTAGVAIVTTGLMTLASLPLTGLAPWADWLARGRAIDWLGQPLNASVWSIASRAVGGDIAGAGVLHLGWWLPAIAITSFVAWWRTIHVDDPDRRWTLALLVSVLFSPLGWAYYVPLVYLPAVASWRPWGWASVVLYGLPMPILWLLVGDSVATAQLIGATYPIATLWAWAVWAHEPLTSRME